MNDADLLRNLKEGFLKKLEGWCPAMDDHEGAGSDLNLLARCGKCREQYDFVEDLINRAVRKIPYSKG